MSAPLLAAFAAMFSGSIALQQWLTAYHRLRLDLFDRRLAIHTAARDFIASVTVTGNADGRRIAELVFATRQARWLLSKEMQSYFDDEMIVKAWRMHSIEAELDSLATDDRNEKLHIKGELFSWFQAQRDVVDEKFDGFLQMPSLKKRSYNGDFKDSLAAVRVWGRRRTGRPLLQIARQMPRVIPAITQHQK